MLSTRAGFRGRIANQISYLDALLLIVAFSLSLTGCSGLVSQSSSNTAPTGPLITTQPASQTVTTGQTATFSVTATGTAPLSYQWKKNGTTISGATSLSYTTPATTSSDNGAQFAVVVSNTAGSLTSSAATLTVSSGTTPPSVPTGLSALAASSSQINLTWNASTGSVAGYKILRGGSQVGTSTTTSYSDAGLAASTSFTYTVAAYDAAGNTSAQSAGASATTLASGGGGIPSGLGWYQIPNTKIRPLCPTYAEIQANEGCPAVMVDWSGGLFDTKRNRLIIFGGGHNGYYGNEIYGIDLNANPINAVLIKDASHGSAVSNVSSCPEAYLDGTPVSRHTYDGALYLPNQDSYMIYSGSRANCGSLSSGLWNFNPSSLTWTQQSISGPAPNPSLNGSIPYTAYDPSTANAYEIEANAAVFWKYDPVANAWTKLADASVCGSLDMTTAVDPGRRIYFCVGRGSFAKVSLNSPYTATTLTGTGCSPLVNAGGPGFTYDPVQKRMVGWAGGNTVYIYNPDTDSCSTVTNAGGPTTIQGNGTYGRFQYSPASGVFIVVNDIDSNAYTLRLSPASGSNSGPVISNVSTASITTSGATNTWTTDVGATTQAEYGTTTAYGSSTALDSSLVTSHSATLSALTSNTLYHYRVHSSNSSGVESISNDFAFQTSNTTDTIPPVVSITAPLPNTTVSGTVSLTANATDNVGVKSVQFLLDSANLGAQLSSSPYSLSWDTTTAPNGSHSLAAVAQDAAGNAATSVSVAVTISNNTVPSGSADFQTRCTAQGVVRCVGFDSPSDISGTYGDSSGILAGNAVPTLDSTVKASGNSALKFTIPSNSGSDSSGSYFTNFSTDLSTQFGENSEFFVQWRQRFSPEFVNTKYQGGGGWKQAIIGAGDQPGCSSSNSTSCISSCSALEVVTQNTYTRGFPQMYNSCTGSASHGAYNPFEQPFGASDFKMQNGMPAPFCLFSQGLTSPPSWFPPTGNCFGYFPNEWMTFQVHIKTGPWVNGEFVNSLVQLWIAREGQASQLVFNWGPYNLSAGSLAENMKYGKVWLLPYNTGKDSSVSYPTAYTWYDELIISTQRIADPK